jgi:hypothetical protein
MNDDNEDKKEGAPAHPTVEPPVPHVDAPFTNVPTQPFPTSPPGVGGGDENPELKIRR